VAAVTAHAPSLRAATTVRVGQQTFSVTSKFVEPLQATVSPWHSTHRESVTRLGGMPHTKSVTDHDAAACTVGDEVSSGVHLTTS
jgi:hypothetical protein